MGRRLHDPARERRPVASSPTSTATTSACPTTTTPPAAATTASRLGADGPEPGSAPERRRHRRPAPATSAPGTSSSSAGSTTRSSRPARTATLELGPHEYNTEEAQARSWSLPKKDGHHRGRRAVRGRARRGGAARGDDLANTMTRSVDLTGKSTATLTLKASCDIEDCDYDYLYVRATSTAATTWTGCDGTVAGKPITSAAERQRHRRHQQTALGAGRRSTCRPTPARRSSLRFRYRTDGGVAARGLLRRRDQGRPRTATDGVHRRRRGRRRAAGRSTASRASAATDHRRATTTTTSPSHRNYVVVRQVPEDRPVQLRLRQHAAGLGGALPVPGRPADLVLGHLAGRQQHQRAPG